MQLKTGIDLVHIPRINKLIENKPALKKIFHKSELQNPKAEHLAGIFALKEAFFKALKQRPKWLSIEITNKPNGAPKIKLSNEIKILLDSKNPKGLENSKNFQRKDLIDIDYSISHDNEYAIASVTILTK